MGEVKLLRLIADKKPRGNSGPAGPLLSRDAVALAEKPPIHRDRRKRPLPYYEVSLQRFSDTDICQWYVRSKANTHWYPYGPRMKITAAGKRAMFDAAP